MKTTFLIVIVTVALFSASVARADHYEVFLIAGQSNCDGRGKVADLTGPLAAWAEPQKDVLIAYSCSSNRGKALTTDGFVPLRPGFSVAPSKTRPTELPTGTFGPEVSFGRGMADHFKGKKVALIKYAEGGTSLAKDWNTGSKGHLYAQFLSFTRKSMKDLKDKGHTATIRGMIWHQGESDAGRSAEDYETLLKDLVIHTRKDLDVPNLPFGIGEVFDNGKRDTVRKAQKSTAANVKGAFLVTVEGLKTSDAGTHFDSASQIELGKRFAAGMAKAVGE